jgi:uncharacterized protein YndB with AHSA1/START domain
MTKGLVAKAEIVINAPAKKVWEALVTPEIIKKYLFGTEAVSDFRTGSSIAYRGEWEGKKYEDKGKILEVVPEKLLVSTYWSSMGGRPDTAENYSTVMYELSGNSGFTRLTITQDNNLTEESRAHSEKNWNLVLKTLKDLLEK